MKTLGIDLATKPKKTGVCVIEWKRTGAEATFPKYGELRERKNSLLIRLMKECAWTAIDSPFGWPEGFRCALRRWAEEDEWVGTAESDEDARMWLARRATDRFVYRKIKEEEQVKSFREPLAVGANTLGATAMRCAELLDGYHKDKEEPLNRVDGPVIETYPAAAKAMWAKYEEIAEERGPWLERCGVIFKRDEEKHVREQEKGHDFDALICALVARARYRKLTFAPPKAWDREQLEREGWIHFPRPGCLLSKLR